MDTTLQAIWVLTGVAVFAIVVGVPLINRRYNALISEDGANSGTQGSSAPKVDTDISATEDKASETNVTAEQNFDGEMTIEEFSRRAQELVQVLKSESPTRDTLDQDTAAQLLRELTRFELMHASKHSSSTLFDEEFVVEPSEQTEPGSPSAEQMKKLRAQIYREIELGERKISTGPISPQLRRAIKSLGLDLPSVEDPQNKKAGNDD